MSVDVYASRTPAIDRGDGEALEDLSWWDRRAFDRAGIDHGQAYPDGFFGWKRWAWVCHLSNRFFSDEMHLTDRDVSVPGLDWVPPEAVQRIAQILDEINTETLRTLDDPWQPDADQIEGMRRFFRVCARRGLGLVHSS